MSLMKWNRSESMREVEDFGWLEKLKGEFLIFLFHDLRKHAPLVPA